MASLEEMHKLAEEVVETYVNRLEAFSRIVEDAYDLLSRGRAEREEIGSHLRELLAEGNSLRRKDFDRMMGEILNQQNDHEENIRLQFKNLLQEQANMAHRLKEALNTGDSAMVRTIRLGMEKGLNDAKQILSDFHHEEQGLMRRFRILLNKGPKLTVTEFKTAIHEIKNDLNVWMAG